jgi:hypothetical protein
MFADGESGMPSNFHQPAFSSHWVPKRTFGHAVQTSQIAPLCDADAQIVMLSVERVRQEIRKGFRLLDRFPAIPRHRALRPRNWRNACGEFDIRPLYRSIRRNASCP